MKKPTITIPTSKNLSTQSSPYYNVGKKRKSSFSFHFPKNTETYENLEGKLKSLRKLSGNSDIYTAKCTNLIQPELWWLIYLDKVNVNNIKLSFLLFNMHYL